MPRKEMRQTFSYYMHDGSTAFSFELAGDLSDEGARELEQAWRTATSVIGEKELLIDLSYVTGFDEAGHELLNKWHAHGARLVVISRGETTSPIDDGSSRHAPRSDPESVYVASRPDGRPLVSRLLHTAVPCNRKRQRHQERQRREGGCQQRHSQFLSRRLP
jgi:hypothetical protein